MAINPISTPLPADLPENWQTGQTVAPEGSDVGLSEQYGYNYQSKQINHAQKAVNAIGAQFPNLYGKGDTVQVSDGGTGGKTAAEALLNLGAQPGFNLLVNSRFAYNGRNQASYTGAGFTVDGWQGSANLATSVISNGVTLSPVQTGTYAIFRQNVFQANNLVGKTVTFSVATSDGNITSVTQLIPSGTFDGNNVAIPGTQWYIDTFSSANTALACRVISNNSAQPSDSLTLTAAKLELGSVSTLAADLAQGQDEAVEQLRLDLYDLDPGRPAWVLTQNENLLDNWYFVGGGSQQGGGQFPINQRGQTSYTGVGYGIDRWTYNLRDASYGTISIQPDGLEINVNTIAPSNATQYTSQRIEPTKFFKGQTYTFSYLVDSLEENGQAVVQLTDSPYTTLVGYTAAKIGLNTLTFIVPQDLESTISVYMLFRNSTGKMKIRAAKLELGPRSTLARLVDGKWVLNDPPPNFQQELAKCQRYLLMGDLEAPFLTADKAFCPVTGTRDILPSIIGTPRVLTIDNNDNVPDAVVSLRDQTFKNGVVLTITGAASQCYVFFPVGSGLSWEL